MTSIEKYTFSGCYRLRSITIPSSVTSIKYGAFSRCEQLQTVLSLNSTPPSLENYVFHVVEGSFLYVPLGSKDSYINAGYGEYFSDIIEMDVSSVSDIYLNNENRTLIYDLSGRQLGIPRKGINISNGKKVFIK